MAVSQSDLRNIEVPDGLAIDPCDISLKYTDMLNARSGPTRTGKPSLMMYYGNDSALAARVYQEVKTEFANMSPEEQAETSLGKMAMTRMMIENERAEAAKAATAAHSFSPQTSAKRTQNMTKAKKSLVRRTSKVTNPFASLKITGLSSTAKPPELGIILRYLENGTPIEEAFVAHWVDIKDDGDGRITEMDAVIDTRYEQADLPSPVDIAGNNTMSVSIYADGEEIEFEAVRGMFESQLGVFVLYKFLAAY